VEAHLKEIIFKSFIERNVSRKTVETVAFSTSDVQQEATIYCEGVWRLLSPEQSLCGL
jgi:predicted RNA-binding protein with PIN domain